MKFPKRLTRRRRIPRGGPALYVKVVRIGHDGTQVHMFEQADAVWRHAADEAVRRAEVSKIRFEDLIKARGKRRSREARA